MSAVATEAAPQADPMTVEELELARVIITALKLDMQPMEIDPTAPLYGEGLGLDSIDVLEVALAISRTYGVKLRSDDRNNARIFSSLRSLSQHIHAHRVR